MIERFIQSLIKDVFAWIGGHIYRFFAWSRKSSQIEREEHANVEPKETLSEQIKELENKIESATDDLERQELLNQLTELEDRLVEVHTRSNSVFRS